MEVLERRARIDAEFFDEERPRRAIHRESVSLPTGAVEREHELPVQSFPQRVAGDQGLEPGRHVAMPSERQLRLDVVLHRREPFLFKLHAPENYIVGGGFFATSSLLPASLAWQAFGVKNGVRPPAS